VIYRIFDIFFLFFHSALTLFNLFGWIWKKIRLLNLLTLIFTGLSWFLLGFIVGIPGYCPLTDWHFKILEKLGKHDLPNSYIKYLADRITGFDFNANLIDNLTLSGFLIALIISLTLNLKSYFKQKRKSNLL